MLCDCGILVTHLYYVQYGWYSHPSSSSLLLWQQQQQWWRRRKGG
jgi:hypothetical protein